MTRELCFPTKDSKLVLNILSQDPKDKYTQSQNLNNSILLSALYCSYHPGSFKDQVLPGEEDIIRGNIIIEGFGQSTEEIIGHDQIREFLNYVPAFFLQAIYRIRYGGSDIMLDKNPDRKKSGDWGRVDILGEKDVSEITLYSSELSMNNTDYRSISRGEFISNPYLSTLAHEIGHNAGALADPEILAKWDVLQRSKSIDLSSYTEDIRSGKIKSMRWSVDVENFAIAFQLFLTHPGKLLKKSKESYDFMCNYVTSKMTPQERTKFDTFHKKQLEMYSGVSLTNIINRSEDFSIRSSMQNRSISNSY
jgi:hypothetical protein